MARVDGESASGGRVLKEVGDGGAWFSRAVISVAETHREGYAQKTLVGDEVGCAHKSDNGVQRYAHKTEGQKIAFHPPGAISSA